MQSRSSGTVRLFWLDKAQVLTRLTAAVERMASEYPEVDRVVLFGSLARGDALPGSDADLLVLLQQCDVPFQARLPRYLPRNAGIGVDVFAYTRSEFTEMAARSPRWAREVQAGSVLFRRRAGQDSAPGE